MSLNILVRSRAPPHSNLRGALFFVGTFRAGGGILFPGEVYIEAIDSTVDTEQGFVAELTVDTAVAPNFMVGLFALMATTEDEEIHEDATVTDLGVTLKARFGTLGQFEIRPGLAMGYQMIEVGDIDDVIGLNVAAILEALYYIDPVTALVGELSFISQPVGGSDDWDVTFAPILFIAVGAAFGG